ncbi:hypothetical protein UCG_01690 [Enterococcus faecalis EnGen0240]|uniref:hypothetical protein n=1 Tax=Enterococcus TaxID=1350 RepID=UPI0002F71445|nr:hypothetical protein [Enterococcus faecalis]ELS0425286.1 hypothetical protein [Enterococcus faecalis]EOL53938.1 hypothetical protein UCG_01690 [Enterococcus faecalis EnGen0240]MDU7106229.1 hypothetical protein [Enterococcus faecalis]NSS75395.1 hypothetical protein [Enterococcus faecalis]OSH24093.1 hypothetical protein EFNM313_1606 [Enterococcus faecalis]
MSKKAVWLSDIEFIEMHSSDWERLESEAFEADESVQAQLNESQQIVLDWLKNDMLDDSDFYNTIYNSRFLHVNGEPHRKENIAFMKLKNKELAQVIQAFSQWALEQEEE